MPTIGPLFLLGPSLRACSRAKMISRGLGVPPWIGVWVASVLALVLVVLVWLAISASSSSTLALVLAFPVRSKSKETPNQTHPGPYPCTSGCASRTPGARPPPQHQRHTPEDTTLLHRRTSCPCLCLQCTRAPVFLSFFFHQKKNRKLGGGERNTTTNGTRTPHTAHTPVNGRHEGQDTAHARASEGNKGTRHHGLAHR